MENIEKEFEQSLDLMNDIIRVIKQRDAKSTVTVHELSTALQVPTVQLRRLFDIILGIPPANDWESGDVYSVSAVLDHCTMHEVAWRVNRSGPLI